MRGLKDPRTGLVADVQRAYHWVGFKMVGLPDEETWSIGFSAFMSHIAGVNYRAALRKEQLAVVFCKWMKYSTEERASKLSSALLKWKEMVPLFAQARAIHLRGNRNTSRVASLGMPQEPPKMQMPWITRKGKKKLVEASPASMLDLSSPNDMPPTPSVRAPRMLICLRRCVQAC